MYTLASPAMGKEKKSVVTIKACMWFSSRVGKGIVRARARARSVP